MATSTSNNGTHELSHTSSFKQCLKWKHESYNKNSHIQKQHTQSRRVGLAQLVRFLVVELTHPDSNPTFDIGVTFVPNYSFSGR
jgi:hypothetical protein